MTFAENRTVWPHADPAAAAEHLADHNAIAVALNARVTGGVLRKTAAQTLTLTTQTAITDMVFAVAANSTYYFSMLVLVTTSSGTSPTTAYGFTGPAAATAVALTRLQETSTTLQSSQALTAFGTFTAGAQIANTFARFEGVVVTGGTSGTVQLTAARAGTVPSMVVAAGSLGQWLKVA